MTKTFSPTFWGKLWHSIPTIGLIAELPCRSFGAGLTRLDTSITWLWCIHWYAWRSMAEVSFPGSYSITHHAHVDECSQSYSSRALQLCNLFTMPKSKGTTNIRSIAGVCRFWSYTSINLPQKRAGWHQEFEFWTNDWYFAGSSRLPALKVGYQTRAIDAEGDFPLNKFTWPLPGLRLGLGMVLSKWQWKPAKPLK